MGDEDCDLCGGRDGNLHGAHYSHHLWLMVSPPTVVSEGHSFPPQGPLLRPGLRDPVPPAALRGPLPRLVQHLRLPLLLLPGPRHQSHRRRESGGSSASHSLPGLPGTNTGGGEARALARFRASII